DGEKLGSFNGEGVGRGSVGITVAGQGRFAFQDFRLGKPRQAPRPGPGGLSETAPKIVPEASGRAGSHVPSLPPRFKRVPQTAGGEAFVAEAPGRGTARTDLRATFRSLDSY